jgi:hypothetical protein
MNRSRFVLCLGLFLSCVIPSPSLIPVALAESAVSDSTSSLASPASTSSPDSIESTLTIVPYKGEPFKVEFVGYWSMDSFRYRTVDGEVGYLTASRIRAIEGAKGKNRLTEMLRERSSFGVFRRGPKRVAGPFLKRPFLAKPLRERSHYLVLEFGTSARATGLDRSDISSGLFSSGIGAIRNLSPRWGLGGMVQFHSDGQDYRAISAGVRLRHYLAHSLTIETTQGLFESNVNGRKGVPYFGEVAVSAADAVSLYTRVENHDYERTYAAFGFYSQRVETSDMVVHVGLRLGPRPNYLSIPGFLVGSIVALSPGARELY